MNDLVIGTFGRGIYAIDDYSVRYLTKDKLIDHTTAPILASVSLFSRGPKAWAKRSGQRFRYNCSGPPSLTF